MGFLGQVLTTMTSRIVILLVGLASSAVLARSLGAERQGAFALSIQVCTWAVLLSSLGIDLGVAYYEAQNTRAAQILAFLTRFGLLWGGLVALLTWGITRWVRGALLQSVPDQALVWSVLCVPVLLILNYQLAYLWGSNRLIAYNGIVLFQTILLLFLQLGIVLAWRAGVVGALIAYFVAQATAVGLTLVLNRVPVWQPRLSVPWSRILIWVRFGFKGQLSSVLLLLFYRLDLFLLNASAAIAQVGYYSVAVNLTNAISYLADAVSFVLFPRIAAATPQEAEALLPVVCRNTLFSSFLGALALGVACPWLIRLLYGKDYLDAVTPLRLLLPGAVALSLNKPIASYQLGQGRSQIALYVTLITIPVTLVAFFSIIPRFGMFGAALACSCSYIVTTIVNLIFLVHFSRVRLSEVLLIRASDWALYRSWFASIQRVRSGRV